MWKTVKLGDICQIGDGNHSSNYPKSSEMVKQGVPFLRAGNIQSGTISDKDLKFITLKKHLILKKGHLKKGDVLITNRGEIGKTAIVPKIFESKSKFSGSLAVSRERLLSAFLYYVLNTPSARASFKSRQTGTALQQLTIRQIKQLEIPLPPLAEQERIVAKLDAAFAEIDGAIERAQVKEKEIQKLKACLLNISLSSDAVESETLKLGDLCDVITKGTTPTSVGFKFESDGINFIKVESLTSNNGFIPAKFAKISTDCNESLKRSQLQKGDILFSIAGALGRTAVVTEDILPANTNQALAIIRLKSNIEIDTRFLLYLLNSDTTREQSERNKGGVAQQNLSLTQLKNYDVYLPSFTEQQQIVARLDAAFNEFENANGAIKKSKLNYSSLKAAILTKELQSSEAA